MVTSPPFLVSKTSKATNATRYNEQVYRAIWATFLEKPSSSVRTEFLSKSKLTGYSSTMAAPQVGTPATSSLTADFYNALGADYEKAFGHNEGLARFIQRSLTYFKPSSHVLDIGCGTGSPVARTIAQQGHHVRGIDIAPSMIELSRKAVPSGTFEVANMLEYTPNEPVDVILSVLSLFGLSREELEGSMSAKWADWLVPGGLLCIVTIALDSIQPSKELYDPDRLCARKIPERFMGRVIEVDLMAKEFWIGLLENVGFEILHTEDDFFEPPPEAQSENETHFFIIARKK